jgi:hypothetical protein
LSDATNLLLPLIVFGYPLLCVIAPYKKHRPCRGYGSRVVEGSVFRRGGAVPCLGCEGTGRVPRLGSRLLASFTRRRR